ncbi:hypothetical protein [Dictyobacter halimunensis]|uniref:hypothetical protein n=1 Tax=Dictyobacter halimunensis TaxID=3026934 RepID=UPI0030C76908
MRKTPQNWEKPANRFGKTLQTRPQKRETEAWGGLARDVCFNHAISQRARREKTGVWTCSPRLGTKRINSPEHRV